MADFKEMYLKLFRSQTKVITLLQEAQRETEDMYVDAEPAEIKLFPADATKIPETETPTIPRNPENKE